jgi:hypothetical protein
MDKVQKHRFYRQMKMPKKTTRMQCGIWSSCGCEDVDGVLGWCRVESWVDTNVSKIHTSPCSAQNNIDTRTQGVTVTIHDAFCALRLRNNICLSVSRFHKNISRLIYVWDVSLYTEIWVSLIFICIYHSVMWDTTPIRSNLSKKNEHFT